MRNQISGSVSGPVVQAGSIGQVTLHVPPPHRVPVPRQLPAALRDFTGRDEALAANPDVAEKIRGGKVQAAGAIVGAVMKATKGQADAARVRELVLAACS